jgi:hypothetical protein
MPSGPDERNMKKPPGNLAPRNERAAAALRENLRKRKAQATARAQASGKARTQGDGSSGERDET